MPNIKKPSHLFIAFVLIVMAVAGITVYWQIASPSLLAGIAASGARLRTAGPIHVRVGGTAAQNPLVFKYGVCPIAAVAAQPARGGRPAIPAVQGIPLSGYTAPSSGEGVTRESAIAQATRVTQASINTCLDQKAANPGGECPGDTTFFPASPAQRLAACPIVFTGQQPRLMPGGGSTPLYVASTTCMWQCRRNNIGTSNELYVDSDTEGACTKSASGSAANRDNPTRVGLRAVAIRNATVATDACIAEIRTSCAASNKMPDGSNVSNPRVLTVSDCENGREVANSPSPSESSYRVARTCAWKCALPGSTPPATPTPASN